MNSFKKLSVYLLRFGLICTTVYALLFYIDHVAQNAQQTKIDKIYDLNYNKVFRVEDPKNPNAHGTGFLAKAKSGKKVIITNAHVCRKYGTEATIRNDYEFFRSEILYQNGRTDICILDGSQSKIEPVTIAFKPLLINDLVYSLGFPLNLRIMLSEGIFSNVILDYMNEPFDGQSYCDVVLTRNNQAFCSVTRFYLLSTMHIMPGQSGSPIFNQNGELVAMAFVNLANGVYSGFIFLEEIQKVLNEY